MDIDPLDMRPRCAVCGVDMWPCRPTKVYCSEACKKAAYQALERRVQAADNARKRCAGCGAPMAPNKRRDALFCSRSCPGRPHYYAGQRACGWCGGAFRAVNKDQRTCSISCGQKLRQSQRRRG